MLFTQEKRQKTEDNSNSFLPLSSHNHDIVNQYKVNIPSVTLTSFGKSIFSNSEDILLEHFHFESLTLDNEAESIPQRPTYQGDLFTKRINTPNGPMIKIEARYPYEDPYSNKYNIGEYGIDTMIYKLMLIGNAILEKLVILKTFSVLPSKVSRGDKIVTKAWMSFLNNDKKYDFIYSIIKHMNVEKISGFICLIPLDDYNQWVYAYNNRIKDVNKELDYVS